METETKLSQRMKSLGLTDKALAKSANVDRSRITKFRLGTASPSLKAAIRVCEVTGLRPEDLYVGSKEAAE